MKLPRTRWPRPSQALGVLAIAGVLGAWILTAQPASARRGALAFGGVSTAAPLGVRIVPAGTPTRFPEPRGPVDRCLVPAPDVDSQFVVPAPRVDDRSIVAPRVWGMPVSSRTSPGR